jgi:hypothetical protein
MNLNGMTGAIIQALTLVTPTGASTWMKADLPGSKGAQ